MAFHTPSGSKPSFSTCCFYLFDSCVSKPTFETFWFSLIGFIFSECPPNSKPCISRSFWATQACGWWRNPVRTVQKPWFLNPLA